MQSDDKRLLSIRLMQSSNDIDAINRLHINNKSLGSTSLSIPPINLEMPQVNENHDDIVPT